MGHVRFMAKQLYETLKVKPGTARLLRQLSFEKDIPVTTLVMELAKQELKRLGVDQR
jgi:hypothetical protein